MGVAEGGVWKLLIFTLAGILIIGAILNLVISPFVDYGISFPANPTAITSVLTGVVNTMSAIIPTSLTSFLNQQILIIGYLPETIQLILVTLISVIFIYIIYVAVAMLIP